MQRVGSLPSLKSIKSPFRDLIGFTSAVEDIGNAHVDLLGCRGNKAPKTKIAMLLKIVWASICSCKGEHCTKLSTERSMIPTHKINLSTMTWWYTQKLSWHQAIWVPLFCLFMKRSLPSITSRPSLSKHRVDHRLDVIYAFGNGGHHHNHSLSTLLQTFHQPWVQNSPWKETKKIQPAMLY